MVEKAAWVFRGARAIDRLTRASSGVGAGVERRQFYAMNLDWSATSRERVVGLVAHAGPDDLAGGGGAESVSLSSARHRRTAITSLRTRNGARLCVTWTRPARRMPCIVPHLGPRYASSVVCFIRPPVG